MYAATGGTSERQVSRRLDIGDFVILIDGLFGRPGFVN